MRKAEIYRVILEVVTEETEINQNEILSRCLRTEVVDARHILVRLLFDNGLYVAEISTLTNISRRNINQILSDFQARAKFGRMFGILYANSERQVRERLANNPLSGKGV